MWKDEARYVKAGFRPGYAECGLCRPPCATCRKCWTSNDNSKAEITDGSGAIKPGDKNCHVWDCPEAGGDTAKEEELAKKGKKTCDRRITEEPSAHFCTSCKQDKYNPPDVRDI
jgi:hypothetical protein